MDFLNPLTWFSGAGSISISPMTLLWLFIIGVPVLMFLIMFLMEVRNSKKSIIFYFESESVINSLLTKIKDGRIFLGKKQVSVDKSSPLQMRTGFLFKSFKPVYFIKHNLALPLRFTTKGIKVYTGENLKHLVENKTLEQLLKPKGADRAIILWLILGIIIGVLVGILLASYGITPAPATHATTVVAGR
jgi:hypothetical protein